MNSGVQDRLLALLEADGVGYSRLMAADPAGTLAQLDAARAVFRLHIEAAGGRVVDMAGDSVLASFASGLAAVQAALAIQAELAQAGVDRPEDQRLRHRIGIHVGDVIEKTDGTVYGSGVNIAARLESLAPPGGIAVSRAVLDLVRSRLPDLVFYDLGLQDVKNIPEPVRAFALGGTAPAPPLVRGQEAATPWRRHGWWIVILIVLALAGGALVTWKLRSVNPVSAAQVVAAEQTLAVLPFASRGDAADEAFAEGLSEELMGLLGRAQGLRVTARSSSFSFKGRPVPAPEMASQLGVEYLVDGSVQRAGERVRIQVQLVRGRDGHTVWSESFERTLADALRLQQLVALQVAQQLTVPLDQGRMGGSGTRNPEAYRLLLEARAAGRSEAEIQAAIERLQRAIALDPDFAAAHAELAQWRWYRLYDDAWYGRLQAQQRAQAAQPVLDALARAEQLDPGNARIPTIRHNVFLVLWNRKAAADALAQAQRLDANDPQVLDRSIEASLLEGDMPRALELAARYVKVAPLSAASHRRQASVLSFAGDAEQTLAAAERALALQPGDYWSLFGLSEAHYALGRDGEALSVAREAVSREPQWNAVLWRLGSDADRERMTQAVQQSGNEYAMAMLEQLQGKDGALLDFLESERGALVQFSRFHFYSVHDRMRQSPRYQALLRKHGLEHAQARAMAWRAAHPRRSLAAP
ncbi:MAG: hypothetical protein J0L58_17855 [Burkholderiales bacterium]|nr:hypothetical protein [Burkholderiales bacterium]